MFVHYDCTWCLLEVTRGCWILWNWTITHSYKLLKWVVGIKLGYSAGAISAFNY